MGQPYTQFSDLARGILSRTLYSDDRIQAVVFGLGQLSLLVRQQDGQQQGAMLDPTHRMRFAGREV
jgi:hypothetical protein